MKLDLPFDVMINGVKYEAGEGVEVAKEHVDAAKEVVAARQAALEVQHTHRGAVAEEAKPEQEETEEAPVSDEQSTENA